MAHCANCGRELPSLTFGESSNLCPDCRAIAGVSQPTPTQAPPAARVRRRPPVTTALVGLNVAVFVAMVASGVSLTSPNTQQLIRWGADFGPLTLSGQPWRLLTSNYVHIGIVHIALNMWCLWNLGFLAELVFDRWTYVLTYTACGLAGSMASLWLHPMAVGAGASGAIFGLAGALIAVLYLGKLPIPRAAMQGTLKSLLTFAGYNLFFGAVAAGIDNSAHIGGLLTGLAVGAVLVRPPITTPEGRQVRRASVFIITALLLVVGMNYVQRRYRASGEIFSPTDWQEIQSATAALQRNDYAAAIPSLQAVVARNPNSPQTRYLLGIAYVGNHQPDDAIVEFQKALQLQPRFADAESGLAMAYQAKGMKPEADQANARAAEMRRTE